MKKKAISLLLILAMMVVLVPSVGTTAFAYPTNYPNTHVNTGDQKEDLIAIAETQIGYTYSGGTKYGAWFGSSYTTASWCAMFVSWCAEQAGISTDIIPRHADCDQGMNWFKNSGRWHYGAYYGGSYTPQRGDIVYYSNGWTQSDSTHVGIVTGVSDNYLQVIEGNTDSKVYKYTRNAKRTLTNGYVLGYGTPNYGGINHDPQGILDAVIVSGNKITVQGWAYDPDNTAATIPIHVFTDNGLGGKAGIGATTADKEKAEVDAVHHCGANHGFDAAFTTTRTGTFNVYVYALNIGEGSDVMIGSKQVYITDVKGGIQSATAVPGKVTVKGWAFDRANSSASVGIHVYIDNGSGGQQYVGGGAANQTHEYANTTYGISGQHGFNLSFAPPRTGTFNVYVYAFSADGKSNALIGSKQVTVPKDTEKPVVSDVKWTVTPGVGYTISCRVTDNAEVAKVQFPTWTEYNGQDDLDKSWSSSSFSAGQKSGDTYTYTVKIADHNNELGMYNTHIYAWDKEGNVSVGGASVEVDGTYVPVATVTDSGHSYTLYDDNVMWTKAKSKCAALGGHLVTITSAHEQSVVEELVKKGANSLYWIGASDAETEGTFQWVTGEAFSYTNWNSGQPDNYNNEDYVHVYKNGKWNDNKVNANGVKIGFILEKDIQYTVKYDANGGTGAPAAQTKTYGKDITLSSVVPTKAGYEFLGWSVNKSAAAAEYKAGAAYTKNEDTVLYAVWKAVTPLTITTQPKSVTMVSGDTAKFNIAAKGDGLTYQWYFKKKGASSWSKWKTAASFTCVTNDTWDGFQAYCVVTDKYGSTVKSDTMTITFKTPLTITTQPKSAAMASGGTAKFSVAAKGDGVTYQWYFKKKGTSSWSKWKTAASFTCVTNDTWDGFQAYCVVTDKYGSTVKSDTMTLTFKTPLTITTQPKSAAMASGGTAKFSVTAKGDGVTYQWYFKKKGASSWSKWKTVASFTCVTNDTWDGFQAYCVVKDKSGATKQSDTMTLTLKTPLSITTQPANVTIASGDRATFRVAAKGDGVTYQWYFKKSGASSWSKWKTTASFTCATNDTWDGFRAYCVVTDKNGSAVKSDIMTITID